MTQNKKAKDCLIHKTPSGVHSDLTWEYKKGYWEASLDGRAHWKPSLSTIMKVTPLISNELIKDDDEFKEDGVLVDDAEI